MRKSRSPLITGFWCRPIIHCATVSILAALTFNSRRYPSFTKRLISAILHIKGMKIMSEMRTLFESLLVLSVLVAAGTVLGIMFR